MNPRAFAWFVIALGVLFAWQDWRALRDGAMDTLIGRAERDKAPIAFWTHWSFRAALALFALVIGVLLAMGVMERRGQT